MKKLVVVLSCVLVLCLITIAVLARNVVLLNKLQTQSQGQEVSKNVAAAPIKTITATMLQPTKNKPPTPYIIKEYETELPPREETMVGKDASDFVQNAVKWFDYYCADFDDPGWCRPLGHGTTKLGKKETEWFCFVEDDGHLDIFFAKSLNPAQVKKFNTDDKKSDIDAGNGVVSYGNVKGCEEWGVIIRFDSIPYLTKNPEKLMTVSGLMGRYGGDRVIRKRYKVTQFDTKKVMDAFIIEFKDRFDVQLQITEYLK